MHTYSRRHSRQLIYNDLFVENLFASFFHAHTRNSFCKEASGMVYVYRNGRKPLAYASLSATVSSAPHSHAP
jgi:hypothetical protein